MPRVRIEGSDLEIGVETYESVAEAAWRQDYVWPSRCWGQRECMQCFVRIRAGEEYVVPADEDELFAMRTKFPPRLRSPLVRLGCCIRVTQDGVVLEKKGVSAPSDSSSTEGSKTA
ncbi:ferredoxin [Rhodococcus ruber BKS 20-38]|uniref:Ferredoxin n=1 Tax=Rhodococcus ruber BKS 20-38 TaxID=1278076 RepID=M2YZ18_9NOCA|nr:ferredoxin [Rhodococcus ruber BKS 20-38]